MATTLPVCTPSGNPAPPNCLMPDISSLASFVDFSTVENALMFLFTAFASLYVLFRGGEAILRKINRLSAENDPDSFSSFHKNGVLVDRETGEIYDGDSDHSDLIYGDGESRRRCDDETKRAANEGYKRFCEEAGWDSDDLVDYSDDYGDRY